MMIRGYSGKVLDTAVAYLTHHVTVTVTPVCFLILISLLGMKLRHDLYPEGADRRRNGRREEKRWKGRGGSGSGWIYCTSGILTNRTE